MTSQNVNEISETHAEEGTSSASSNDGSISNDTALGERDGQAPRVDTMMSQNANAISETQAEEATSSASANNASSSNATIVEHDVQARSQTHIQKIPQRKYQVYNWSHDKKLCKLAVYSACQIPECPCNGWKRILPPRYVPPSHRNYLIAKEPRAIFTDPCRGCNHQLEKHVTQLQGESVGEINRLLGAVIDLENLFMSMRLERNSFLKRGYYYIFKSVYKCIQARSTIRISGPLAPTPYERPSVAKAMANFILYKFNALHDLEWQAMYDLAQMFLYCLNELNLEIPSERQMEGRAETSTRPVSVYEMNYMRWFMACHVPQYCDSLPQYETSLVFGRVFLRDVFKDVARLLVERCHSDTIPPHKMVLYHRQLPQFLALFEVETFRNDSPIWHSHFHQLIDYENDMIEELHALIPPH